MGMTLDVILKIFYFLLIFQNLRVIWASNNLSLKILNQFIYVATPSTANSLKFMTLHILFRFNFLILNYVCFLFLQQLFLSVYYLFLIWDFLPCLTKLNKNKNLDTK